MAKRIHFMRLAVVELSTPPGRRGGPGRAGRGRVGGRPAGGRVEPGRAEVRAAGPRAPGFGAGRPEGLGRGAGRRGGAVVAITGLPQGRP